MSVRDSIDGTNTQKNKLKIGKQNIDNKLVELGGEKAIDISDIPNKIKKLTEQYSKVALGSRICKPQGKGSSSKIINVNADFEIKRVIGVVGFSDDLFTQDYERKYMGIDSDKHNSSSNSRYNEYFGKAYINNLSNNFKINFTEVKYTGNDYYIQYIALG